MRICVLHFSSSRADVCVDNIVIVEANNALEAAKQHFTKEVITEHMQLANVKQADAIDCECEEFARCYAEETFAVAFKADNKITNIAMDFNGKHKFIDNDTMMQRYIDSNWTSKRDFVGVQGAIAAGDDADYVSINITE